MPICVPEARSAGLIDWSRIDTVLLDMDGTLPRPGISTTTSGRPTCRVATRRPRPRARSGRGTDGALPRAGWNLAWYSVDFWETELEMDIMRFKEEVAHLIDIHPRVVEVPRRRASQRSPRSARHQCAPTRASR